MEDMVKPRPAIANVSRPYWEAARQGRLLYQRCRSCGAVQFPFQTLCRVCLSHDLAQEESSGHGTVYSHSTVWRAPSEAFKPDVPYTVAIVELAEGFRMTSSLLGIDPESVRINLPVVVTFDHLDEEFSLPRFRPDTADGALASERG